MSAQEKEDSSQFRCTLCNFTATSKGEIGNHFLTDHMEAYVSPVKEEDKSGSTTDSKGPGSDKVIDKEADEERDEHDESDDDYVDLFEEIEEKKPAPRPRGRPPGRSTGRPVGRPPKKNTQKPIKKQPYFYIEEIDDIKEEEPEEPQEFGRGMRRRKKAIPRHILRYELDEDESMDDEDDDQTEKKKVLPKKRTSSFPSVELKPRGKRGRPRGSTSQERSKQDFEGPKISKKVPTLSKLPLSNKVIERILDDRVNEWYSTFQERHVLPIPCPFEGCALDVTQAELDVHLQCHAANLEGFRCPIEECNFLCPHWSNMRVHYRKVHDPAFYRLLCGLPGCSMIFPRIDKKSIFVHVTRKHLRPVLYDEMSSKNFNKEKYEKYVFAVKAEEVELNQALEDTECDEGEAETSLEEPSDAMHVEEMSEVGNTETMSEFDTEYPKVKRRGRPPGSTKAAKLARIAAGEIIEKKDKKDKKGKGKRSFNRVMNNVSFFCDLCGGKYKSEQAVFDHKTLHYRDDNCNVLCCTECTEFTAEDSSELRDHVVSCHKRLLHLHRCDLCQFSTNRFHDLKKHILVHSGSKDYMCDKCGTCTTTAYNLRVHWRRYHAPDSEKNVKCFACDYVCADNGILKEHIRSKHGMMVYGKDFDNARPLPTYSCTECDYVGRKKSSLDYHMRIHTENRQFKCHICPYASKTKNNLLLHIRTHEGMQPLKCPECDFRGATNKIISEHVMCKHARVRPYTCKICGWTSSYHGNMWKHVETHRRELGDAMPEEPVSVISTEGHMVAAPLKAPTLKKRGGGGSTSPSGSAAKTPKMRGKRNNRPRFEEMEVTVETQVHDGQDDSMKEGVVIQLPVSTVLDGQTITLAEGISEEAAMGASALSRLSQGGEITVREVHFLQGGDNQQQHHEMITYNVPPVAVTQQIIAGGDMSHVISEAQYHQQHQQHQQSQEHEVEHHYVEAGLQTVQVVTTHQDSGVPRAVTEQVVHAIPHQQDHHQEHHQDPRVVEQHREEPIVHQLIPMTLPHEAELVMSMMQAHQANISQAQ
nr:uncharacterized protein LOC129253775 [Lytechinus pictus]